MASATQAGLRRHRESHLGRVYVALSTLLVWLPLCIVLLAGARADEPFARGQTWSTKHAGTLRVWLSLGIGGAS